MVRQSQLIREETLFPGMTVMKKSQENVAMEQGEKAEGDSIAPVVEDVKENEQRMGAT